LRWQGLPFSREQFDSVIGIDTAAWQEELSLHDELFTMLEQGLPEELRQIRQDIARRLEGTNPR
jgi:phosphoenolpyruvate carboxykinase (GTP)